VLGQVIGRVGGVGREKMVWIWCKVGVRFIGEVGVCWGLVLVGLGFEVGVVCF
jgi:hypothetical protein